RQLMACLCFYRVVYKLSEQEGTIRFAYSLAPLEPALCTNPHLAELSAWREILHRLDLLGQHADRYGGYAYGNLSIMEESGSFLITASQTSGAPELLMEHLVRISEVNFERFWAEAAGSEPPSSETLTHGMIYAAERRANCVFHVHNPEIWQQHEALNLPATAADVAYGTPAMARAVHELLQTHQSRPLVFATAGHEDGIFALGHSPWECGSQLVACLAKARALRQVAASGAA
ncbi:MAG: class II aldolase/adducin family protein, partial [Pseudomonadota bacterium]